MARFFSQRKVAVVASVLQGEKVEGLHNLSIAHGSTHAKTHLHIVQVGLLILPL